MYANFVNYLNMSCFLEEVIELLLFYSLIPVPNPEFCISKQVSIVLVYEK